MKNFKRNIYRLSEEIATTTQPPSGCKEFISFDYKTTNDLPVRYKICGSNDWVYYTFTGLPFSGGVYITYTIDLEFPSGLCIQDGSWEYLGTEGGTPNMNNFVYGNTCTPLPALCYQIDGVWVDPDPVHPGGGTLTYVDENYQLQTITGIWEGFNQLITIRDVIYHVGVNGFNTPVSCTPTTTTIEPTTTVAPPTYTSLGDSQWSSISHGAACSSFPGVLYSNCAIVEAGAGCILYTDTIGTPLLNNPYVYLQASGSIGNWDVNPATGEVINYAPVQC